MASGENSQRRWNCFLTESNQTQKKKKMDEIRPLINQIQIKLSKLIPRIGQLWYCYVDISLIVMFNQA